MRRMAVWLMAGLTLGCGGGDPDGSRASDKAQVPSARAGNADPAPVKRGCDLLTDTEVGEATGTAISSHEESGLNGCNWRGKGRTQLMLDVYSGSSLASRTCDAQKMLGTGREEAVPGLGDSAQWKGSGSLVVCTATAVIRFNLDNSSRTVPENKEALMKLARSALGRM
jgi:hypothetical protein